MSSEYLPILFDESFSSCLGIVIHSCRVEYTYQNLNSSHVNSAIAAVLFRNRKTGIPKSYAGAEETNSVYKEFAEFLINNYTSLSEYFTYLTTKLLSSNRRDELSRGSRAPPLTLPGNPI